MLSCVQAVFFNDQPRPQDKRIKNIITVKKRVRKWLKVTKQINESADPLSTPCDKCRFSHLASSGPDRYTTERVIIRHLAPVEPQRVRVPAVSLQP